MTQDVESPPYPGEHTIPGVLFEHLRSLRGWVDQEVAKLGSVRDVIPKYASLPAKDGFERQPILYLWQTFIHMRKIRESWDHLLRTYEADWDDAVCIRGRALILQQAVILMNSAGRSPETREIEAQRQAERLHAVYVHLSQQLVAPLQPSSHDYGTLPDLDG